MAFNGTGTFNRLYSWVQDAANGIKIRADRMDNEMNGMATGLTLCVTRDGQSPAQNNLPMAGFKHTNVGNATNDTDYVALGQITGFLGGLPGFLGGLTLSTAGSSSTFGVAAGAATDSAAAGLMTLPLAYTKTTTIWAVGTAAGSLDTGVIANSTWYHVFLIKRPDTKVVDVLISLSAVAPTLPSGYTLFRRLGSMKTDGSGHWLGFIQSGNRFAWTTAVQDLSISNLDSTPIFPALSVPPGVTVTALLRGEASNASSTCAVLVNGRDEGAVVANTPGGNNTTLVVSTALASSFITSLQTATDKTVRAMSNAPNTVLVLVTYGWYDSRGQG